MTRNFGFGFGFGFGMLRLSVLVSVSVQTKPKFRYFGFGLNFGFGRSLASKESFVSQFYDEDELFRFVKCYLSKLSLNKGIDQ